VSKEPDKCIQRGIQEDQQPPEQYESDLNYKDSPRFAHTSIPRTYEGSYNSHLFQLQKNEHSIMHSLITQDQVPSEDKFPEQDITINTGNTTTT
jgi:hypothetical protein